MKFLVRLIAVAFIFLFPAASLPAIAMTKSDVEAELVMLDNELSRRASYLSERQRGIDSLRTIVNNDLTHNEKWLTDVMTLAQSYNAFNIDSALFYYSTGLDNATRLHLDSIATVFRLRRAALYPVIGFITEAVDEYQSIDTTGQSVDMKCLYFDAGRQMYSYISTYYIGYPDAHNHYSRLATEAQKSLLDLLPPNSARYKLNLGEYFYSRQDYDQARTVLVDLLDELPQHSNMYARAAHILSDIALARNNTDDYIYYLALSALADVKSATLEVKSLQDLGSELYRQGDVDRAYSYLLMALQSAVECNAVLRMIQTAEALPLIEQAHRAELDRERSYIYIGIGILIVILIVLAITMLYLRREMKRMAELRDKLQSANSIKDIYISQFLSLCSIYMDKLNQFCKIANRKIVAGKVDDLYKMTKSGKFVEEQSSEFYEVFDNAFLHIYPTFVENVNRLLRPEEQIVLSPDEKLNTDLRILAFMRLGIEDSGRIAQVLNYSVNTIYTYRNRLKNKAIDRDKFEADVMKISSIN